jgi:hypothetical protein
VPESNLRGAGQKLAGCGGNSPGAASPGQAHRSKCERTMKFLQRVLRLWLCRAVLPDYLEQKIDIDRLGQHRDRAKCARRLCGIHRARHHGDRNARDHWIGQLRASELVAAHPGHPKVEQDQAGRVGLAMTYCAQEM